MDSRLSTSVSVNFSTSPNESSVSTHRVTQSDDPTDSSSHSDHDYSGLPSPGEVDICRTKMTGTLLVFDFYFSIRGSG